MKTADLGQGWFARANDDGSFTIQNPDKGLCIDLSPGEATRFCALHDEATAVAAERKMEDDAA
jgi:hypothetical protein